MHTLANGLRVVIQEDPSWPVVALSMWVHAGGKHETDRVSGYSHYLEHLTSRGTTKRQPLEDRLDIFYVGGLNSANTYHDRTTYYNVVKREFFDVALDVMADVMQNARLPAEGIENERRVVTEELRRYYDNPDTAAYRELFRLAFAPHPYARPVIGTFETLEGLVRDDFYHYYKRMYAPDNMVLAVCGDVTAREALPKIAAAFAGFAPGADLPPPPPLPVAFTGYRDATLRLDLKRSHVNLAFVVPGWRHPDRWALEALGRILGGGASSRLWQRTVNDQKIALHAAADNHTLEDLGLFYLVASPVDPPDAWKLEASLLAEIREISERGVEIGELRRIQRQARLQELFGQEEVLNVAQSLGESALYGGIRYHTDGIERLCALTPADIQDVARRYLVRENLTVVRTLPEDTPEPSAADLEAAGQQAAALAGSALQPDWLDFGRLALAAEQAREVPHRAPILAAGGAADTTRRVLPNGLTVLLRPKRGKGIVAIALHARAGSRFDPPGHEGLAQLASNLPLEGTQSWDQRDLARRFDEWGGYYGLGIDRDLLYGRVVLARADAADGAALLADVVLHPKFDPHVVDQERAKQIARIARQQDSIVDVAWNRYYACVFNGTPYAHSILGTQAGAEACTAPMAADFWRRHVSPERSVLTVVGDLSEREFEELLMRSGFAEWPAPTVPLADPPAPTPADGQTPPPGPLYGVFGEGMDRKQVQLILGAPGVPLTHPDYLAIRTLANLVGFRCFVDLVYNKPLAYSTGGTTAALMEAGTLALFIGSAAKNAELVTEELRAKWRQVVDFPVPEDELGHIKDRIVGGQALSDQRAASLAASYGYYEAAGLGHAFYDRQAELVRTLTAEDLQDAARRYLQPEQLIAAIAGPAAQDPG